MGDAATLIFDTVSILLFASVLGVIRKFEQIDCGGKIVHSSFTLLTIRLDSSLSIHYSAHFLLASSVKFSLVIIFYSLFMNKVMRNWYCTSDLVFLIKIGIWFFICFLYCFKCLLLGSCLFKELFVHLYVHSFLTVTVY